MISVVILTRNSEETIGRCLESTVGLKEVIILDSGSNDRTLEIARSFPHVRVFTSKFQGFGKMRNLGASYASNEWILALDSDEELSDGLVSELKQFDLQSECIYEFDFHNYFNGKWIKWCGWYPDRHARLYDKFWTSFSEDYVHEKLIQKRQSKERFPYPINHYSYRSISDFSKKLHLYSNLFAKQYAGKKESSLWKAISHGCFAFFKSYILKRGFMGGAEGYMISVYNAQTAYYKYLKLYEANRCSSR